MATHNIPRKFRQNREMHTAVNINQGLVFLDADVSCQPSTVFFLEVVTYFTLPPSTIIHALKVNFQKLLPPIFSLSWRQASNGCLWPVACMIISPDKQRAKDEALRSGGAIIMDNHISASGNHRLFDRVLNTMRFRVCRGHNARPCTILFL